MRLLKCWEEAASCVIKSPKKPSLRRIAVLRGEKVDRVKSLLSTYYPSTRAETICCCYGAISMCSSVCFSLYKHVVGNHSSSPSPESQANRRVPTGPVTSFNDTLLFSTAEANPIELTNTNYKPCAFSSSWTAHKTLL